MFAEASGFQIKCLTTRLLGMELDGVEFVEEDEVTNFDVPIRNYVVAKSPAMTSPYLELYRPNAGAIEHYVSLINAPVVREEKHAFYFMYNKLTKNVSLHIKKSIHLKAVRWAKKNSSAFEVQAQRAILDFIWEQEDIKQRIILMYLEELSWVYGIEAINLKSLITKDLIFDAFRVNNVTLSTQFSWHGTSFRILILTDDIKFFIMSNRLGG